MTNQLTRINWLFCLLFTTLSVFSFIKSKAQDLESYQLSNATGHFLDHVIRVDADDNVIRIQNTDKLIELDSNSKSIELNTQNRSSLIITVEDANYHMKWAKTIEYVYIYDADVDVDGNIYLLTLGRPGGELITSGGDTVAIERNFRYVIKVSHNGDILWAQECVDYDGSFVNAKFNRIRIQGSFLYMAGSLYQDYYVDFDPGVAIDTHYISTATVVSAWDTAGSYRWVSVYSCESLREATAMATNESGVVFGGFKLIDGRPDLSDITVVSDSVFGGSFALIKLNHDGKYQWHKRTSIHDMYEISLMSDGGMSIFGSTNFLDSVKWGDGNSILKTYPCNINGARAPVIFSLDSVGNMKWFRSMELDVLVEDQVALMNGQVLVTGTYKDQVDLDPGSSVQLSNAVCQSCENSFLLRLSSTGNYISAQEFRAFSGYNTIIKNGRADRRSDGGVVLLLDYNNWFDFDSSGSEITVEADQKDSYHILLKYGIEGGACFNFHAYVDSFTDASCDAPGYTEIGVEGANGSVSYNWSSGETTNSISKDHGWYKIVVQDSLACKDSINVYIAGPDKTGSQSLVNAVVSEQLRAGSRSKMWVDVSNLACDSISGTFVIMMDTLGTLRTIDPSPDETTDSSVSWNIDDWSYQSGNLKLVVNFDVSTLAKVGDTLRTHFAFIDPSGNLQPVEIFPIPIGAPYDPNDKEVQPLGSCEEHYVHKSDTLKYKVRFQNVGNVEAIDVRIEDELSPYLDPNSIRVLSSSFPGMQTEIREGNRLIFTFDDINLPDSTSDEPNSHGYVVFQVHPKGEIPNNIELRNSVDIYFDFNDPVRTNETFNTLVDVIPSCRNTGSLGEFGNSPFFLIYPNPAESANTIRIISNNGASINSVELLSSIGRQIELVTRYNNGQLDLSLPTLSSGIYFIRVTSDLGQEVVQKIVIR